MHYHRQPQTWPRRPIRAALLALCCHLINHRWFNMGKREESKEADRVA